MKVLVRFVVAVAVLAMLAGFWLAYTMSPTNASAKVRIPQGAGAKTVGNLLQQAGIVRSADVFALYLRYSKLDKDLKPGVYQLEGKDYGSVARSVSTEAKPLQVRLTFPEGWRYKDMAKLVKEQGLDGKTFFELAKTPKTKVWNSPTLEGFLFPATYTFEVDTPAQDVINAMLERSNQEITANVKTKLKALNLSVLQWFTLASVVQAEAGSGAERPWIAGVFLNRMDIGQGLQSDPTVAYGLGKNLNQLNRSKGDFNSDTPYNTYKYAQLPPTAIGNPGHDALQAVLNAKRTNPKGQRYFYFLHAGGKLYLNTNFNGHLRDTQQYYR